MKKQKPWAALAVSVWVAASLSIAQVKAEPSADFKMVMDRSVLMYKSICGQALDVAEAKKCSLSAIEWYTSFFDKLKEVGMIVSYEISELGYDGVGNRMFITLTAQETAEAGSSYTSKLEFKWTPAVEMNGVDPLGMGPIDPEPK